MSTNVDAGARWTLLETNRGPACARSSVFNMGKYIYVLGGVRSGTLVLNSPIDAWRYDIITKKWDQLSLAVTARSDAGSTTDKTYTYLIGGAVGINYLNDVWQFNVNSNAWSKLPNYYAALQGVRLCNYNNILYSVGGGTSSDTNALYTTSMSNPAVWTRRKDFPIPIRSGNFFSLGDSTYLYYAMGWSNGAVNSDVYRYTIATDTWVKIGTAPRGANNVACTVLNGIAYFYGGYSQDNTTLDQNVLTFDGVNWSILPVIKNSPSKRQGSSMLTIDNDIYMYGGIGTSYLSEMWLLKP